MSDAWYFTRGNEVCGPVSSAELRDLAKIGILRPDDLIWPAESEMSDAVIAEAALRFPQQGDTSIPEASESPALTPAPDWLHDLAVVLTAIPNQPEIPTPPSDWLEDVRRTP